MNTQPTGTTVTFSDVLWKFVSLWKLTIILAVLGFAIASIYVSKSYDAKEAEYLPQKTEYDRVMDNYNTEKDFVLKFNSATADEKNTLAEEAADRWTEKLTSEQLSAIDNALSYKKLINENAEYQKNSILLNLDTYNVNTLSMVFETTSETVPVNNLLNTYGAYITSTDFIDELGAKQGWDIVGKGEAIYAELFTVAYQNGNQFAITVQSNIAEDMESLSKAIETGLNKKSQDFKKSLGAHTLALVSKTISVKANNAIAGTKNAIQNQQRTYNDQLNALKNTMKGIPEQYNLYLLKSGMEDGSTEYVDLVLPKEPDLLEPDKLRSKTTYRIIGLILGIVAGMIYAYLTMLFSGRMEKTEELSGLYGMNQAGYIYRKRLIPIDSVISKLKKGKNRPKDNKTAIKLLSDGIGAICKKENISKLVIASTSLKKQDEAALNELKDILKSSGIEVANVGNLLKDDTFKESINKADAVVLAETVAVAKNRYINQEQQLVEGMGAKLLCAFGIE